jgi:hypothetical protein
MPFAFGQTINLSQSSDTRSGITPIKWGFCANDPIGSDFISESVGAGESEKWTAALMHMETSPPSCVPVYDDTAGVASGNFEPNISPIIKTELGWRSQQINANAQKVILYIITRAGSGAGTIQNPISCPVDCIGVGCPACCCYGGCDDCSGKNGCVETECNGGNRCCGAFGEFGGTAGYYKVTFDLTNHTQENLFLGLDAFNTHPPDGENINCILPVANIRVELANAGKQLAWFNATPGLDGIEGTPQQRATCGDCNTCPNPCGGCDGSGQGEWPARGIGDPSEFTAGIASGVDISITVERETPEDFWGPLTSEGSGHLGTVFGWNAASLSTIPDAWTTRNFGGGGSAPTNSHGGSPCTPTGDSCNCVQGLDEIFPWEPSPPEPDWTLGGKYSGQLIGFVVE